MSGSADDGGQGTDPGNGGEDPTEPPPDETEVPPDGDVDSGGDGAIDSDGQPAEPTTDEGGDDDADTIGGPSPRSPCGIAMVPLLLFTLILLSAMKLDNRRRTP